MIFILLLGTCDSLGDDGVKKTNAARLLDKLGIVYQLKAFDADPEDLGALNAARKLSMPARRVFKTLVVRGDRTGVLFACIPGGDELDLKSLAAASKNKKTEMARLKDVFDLTGYIRGGVSPLGAKKRYPVYMDESALQWETIAVSAGTVGAQIILAPEDLAAAADARFARIARQI